MNILELMNKLPELKKIIESVCVVDVGNTFVKTNEYVSIPSTVVEVSKLEGVNDSTSSEVEWNGKLYVVGSRKGDLNMSPDKFKSDHYKVSLLNAITAHFEDKTKIEVRLALGLPPKHYTDYHVELRNEIKALDKQTIKVDDVTYEIKIIDVAVFKQGGTLSAHRREEFSYPLMMLDFGGGTLDISYWEEQKRKKGKGTELYLTETRSFTEFGFELVMSEMVTKCNSIPGSNGKVDSHKLIEYFEKNKIPFAPEGFLEELKKEFMVPYCKNVVAKITTELSPDSCEDIRLIGGPASVLQKYIAPMFKVGNPSLIGDVDEDSQCTNALLFADKYKEELTVEYLEENKEIAITVMAE